MRFIDGLCEEKQSKGMYIFVQGKRFRRDKKWKAV